MTTIKVMLRISRAMLNVYGKFLDYMEAHVAKMEATSR